MRTKSSYEPPQVEYFVGKDGIAQIMLNTNIEKVTGKTPDDFSGWVSDRYTLTMPHSDGLEERINANIKDWLQHGIDAEYTEQSQCVRDARNALLIEQDWTQLQDAPLTEQSRAEFREYRQALRDIPQQKGFPFDVVFPVTPKPKRHENMSVLNAQAVTVYKEFQTFDDNLQVRVADGAVGRWTVESGEAVFVPIGE